MLNLNNINYKKMKVFVTLSDKYYLNKGIALYESINQLMRIDYRLYYLCLDELTFDKLKEINDKKLIPLYIKDEFHNNKDFELLAKNNKSNPNNYSNFHFALGSFFSNYIMEKESPESVLYIDADIIFYHSPEIIFKYANKSIGLILHRHNEIGTTVGGYNVGIIYFCNDIIGKKCLKWWRDVVMDINNKWHETHGMCGDQKYLELFEPLFGKENIKVLDENIGHGAPWNFTLYKYFNDKNIIEWKGNIQNFVFNHFSHFNYDENSYKIQRKNEWGDKLLKNPMIKRYYDEYFKILKNVKRRYEL